MKYYQYITKEKTSPEEELWVCEDCRKLNSNRILEGKWRLIGRQESDAITCDACRQGTQQGTTGYSQDNPIAPADVDSQVEKPQDSL